MLQQTLVEVGTFIAASNDGTGTFLERLDRLAGSVVDYFGAHPDAAQLLLRDFVNNGPFTSAEGKSVVEMTLGGAVAFLKAGKEAVAFDLDDAERVVIAATGYVLLYFGARTVTDGVLGAEGLSADVLAGHRQHVIGHFRRLCGVS